MLSPHRRGEIVLGYPHDQIVPHNAAAHTILVHEGEAAELLSRGSQEGQLTLATGP